MRPILLILVLAAAPAAGQQRAFPTPYCTDGQGNRLELGELTCIAVSCTPPCLARGEMSVYSPMGRMVRDGCPAVSADPRLPQSPAASPIKPG
jgi:hypothetical protein